MSDLTSDRIRQFVHRGDALNNQKENSAKKHARCNHKKGGYIGHNPVVPDAGDSTEYCVIKHTFPWNDTWVICQRCNKKWKPGMPDYQEAIDFPTRNKPSRSITFVVDIEAARELTEES